MPAIATEAKHIELRFDLPDEVVPHAQEMYSNGDLREINEQLAALRMSVSFDVRLGEGEGLERIDGRIVGLTVRSW